MSGSRWTGLKVYGHDGNHYAYNLQNFIYDSFYTLNAYGGGGFNLYGTNASLNFGNSTFFLPYVQTIVGGTANAYTLAASANQRLNLITFERPQGIVNNIAGVTPGGNPPTSSQLVWSEDTHVQNIRKIGPDLETNVGSPFTMGSSAVGNDFDWQSLFTDAGAINAPSWGVNGIMTQPATRTFNDNSSSGTVAAQVVNAFAGTHVTASNATTYSIYATLYAAPPIAGTNVTITRNDAIYATGEIYTTGDITSNGFFNSGGTVQLNTSNLQLGTTLWQSKTAPTLSGSGLGTSPSITANGTAVGTITVGSSPSNATFTLTLPTASHGWICSVSDITNNASLTVGQTATTTTTAVMQGYSRTSGLTSALTASDVLGYQCGAN